MAPFKAKEQKPVVPLTLPKLLRQTILGTIVLIMIVWYKYNVTLAAGTAPASFELFLWSLAPGALLLLTGCVLYLYFNLNANLTLLRGVYLLLQIGVATQFFVGTITSTNLLTQSLVCFALAGIGVILFLRAVPYCLNHLRFCMFALNTATVVLYFILFVFATATRNATAWIYIGGHSIQVTELIRLMILLWMAGWYADNTRSKWRTLWVGTAVMALHLLAFMYLNELGTICILLIVYIMSIFIYLDLSQHVFFSFLVAVALAFSCWFIIEFSAYYANEYPTEGESTVAIETVITEDAEAEDAEAEDAEAEDAGAEDAEAEDAEAEDAEAEDAEAEDAEAEEETYIFELLPSQFDEKLYTIIAKIDTRLLAIVLPNEVDIYNEGYQTTQMKKALLSGKLFGNVLLDIDLPEGECDLIFTSVVLKLGWLVALFVFYCIASIFGASLEIVHRQKKSFIANVLFFFALNYFTQSMILVTSNSLNFPIVGLALSFLSTGGTNLLISYFICSVLYVYSCTTVPAVSIASAAADACCADEHNPPIDKETTHETVERDSSEPATKAIPPAEQGESIL